MALESGGPHKKLRWVKFGPRILSLTHVLNIMRLYTCSLANYECTISVFKISALALASILELLIDLLFMTILSPNLVN